jgi:hypothetical protein
MEITAYNCAICAPFGMRKALAAVNANAGAADMRAISFSSKVQRAVLYVGAMVRSANSASSSGILDIR